MVINSGNGIDSVYLSVVPSVYHIYVSVQQLRVNHQVHVEKTSLHVEALRRPHASAHRGQRGEMAGRRWAKRRAGPKECSSKAACY